MAELHMVSLDFEVAKLLRLHRLPLGCDDEGYLVHSQLTALFGATSLGPFRVSERPLGMLNVLVYSDVPGEALQARASELAEPPYYACCDWSSLASKPMPERWQSGRHLHFNVRVSPTVRAARASEHCRKGAERDAFLAACGRVEATQALTREVVYGDWLRDRLAGQGAELGEVALDGFRLVKLLRKTQGPQRKGRLLPRPDASLSGSLTVTDGERFASALARGIGRHKAFGFGMLMLARPQ